MLCFPERTGRPGSMLLKPVLHELFSCNRSGFMANGNTLSRDGYSKIVTACF